MGTFLPIPPRSPSSPPYKEERDFTYKEERDFPYFGIVFIGTIVLLMSIVIKVLILDNQEPTIYSNHSMIIEECHWQELVEALIFVESSGNHLAVGRNNDVGVLQITPIYVREVNRILKSEKYTLKDRLDRNKSIEMFNIYQNYYNPERDIDRAIFLHNPRAGEWYRDRVLQRFEKEKEKYKSIEI